MYACPCGELFDKYNTLDKHTRTHPQPASYARICRRNYDTARRTLIAYTLPAEFPFPTKAKDRPKGNRKRTHDHPPESTVRTRLGPHPADPKRSRATPAADVSMPPTPSSRTPKTPRPRVRTRTPQKAHASGWVQTTIDNQPQINRLEGQLIEIREQRSNIMAMLQKLQTREQNIADQLEQLRK